MKIKALAAICKKKKRIAFWDEDDRQFVSDFGAVYPLDGLPWMSRENLLTVFDVPEKDREKWLIAESLGDVMMVNLDDVDNTECDVKYADIHVTYCGYELIPLYTSKGIVYINAMHLNPLMDAAGQLTLHERKDDFGQVYIVAKVGLLLQAVIFPMDIIDPTFVNAITELGNKTREVLDIKEGVDIDEDDV